MQATSMEKGWVKEGPRRWVELGSPVEHVSGTSKSTLTVTFFEKEKSLKLVLNL